MFTVLLSFWKQRSPPHQQTTGSNLVTRLTAQYVLKKKRKKWLSLINPNYFGKPITRKYTPRACSKRRAIAVPN